ncbi:alpha/beta hydrolase [Rhodococcus rhodochrous]|uniref:alpha/beta hydrolase n=1 Tax=Rhodococcus rhodochrous TaxID=1829 RepID=UPI00075094AF|nr:alpha/beta hydrolase [Rhodococcus rhodochrous]MDO1484951.1 alpha/beta fold hydrolase [Rhodococcus rhodochrous]SNV15778.1 alpha/beta hydrolase [Rhodococcus rhodochrous]
MHPRSLTFPSGGETVHAWHFTPGPDVPGRADGTPVVVMAHGLGGTKDSGLAPFAERFTAAGMHVLAFDYRGFGESGGTDRQRVDVAGQIADYRAALATARRLDCADPRRAVLWGVSLSGGHVLSVAAQDRDVAAVVSMTPLVDGPAAGVLAARHHAPSALVRSTAAGVRSRVGSVARGSSTTIPIVGPPGTVAALSLDGYHEDYLSLAGPTWRNEIDADVVLSLGTYRPARHASSVSCPVLVQIADFDRSAPPHAAARAAFRARAEVRHYPCDHFDVWPGKDWFDRAVEHQIHFLTRHLAAQ